MNLKHGRFIIQVVVTVSLLIIGSLMIFLTTDQSLKTTGVGFIGSVLTLWFSVKTSNGSKKKVNKEPLKEIIIDNKDKKIDKGKEREISL